MTTGEVILCAIIAALLLGQCVRIDAPRSSNPFERMSSRPLKT